MQLGFFMSVTSPLARRVDLGAKVQERQSIALPPSALHFSGECRIPVPLFEDAPLREPHGLHATGKSYLTLS